MNRGHACIFGFYFDADFTMACRSSRFITSSAVVTSDGL